MAGASSFPQVNFHAEQRAKAEAVLNMCESSSDEEENHAPHQAQKVSDNSSDSRSDGDRHARKKEKSKSKKSKKKHDKKRKRDKHDDPARLIKGDRGKIVRAEREAHARGLALPEKRGTLWAANSSSFGSVLGIPGFSSLDNDLMFSDRVSKLFSLSYFQRPPLTIIFLQSGW